MNVTINDIVSAREWAEKHAGDDSVIDVYQHKLLELFAKSHESSAGFHERTQTKCEVLMAEIEKRFKVEGEDW